MKLSTAPPNVNKTKLKKLNMDQSTPTYTPTLMQKLLGKNFKWWYVAVQGFKSNTTYRYNSIAWLLSSVVLVCGALVVWYINFQNNLNSDGFKEIFTYFVIGESFIFSSAIQFDIGENIQDGKFTSRLLTPTSYIKRYIAFQFGYQLFENLSKMIIYLLIALVFYQYFILANIFNFGLFVFAAIIAYVVNIFIGIIIGASALFLTAFFGSASFFDSLKLVLGGKLFPLNSLKFLFPLVFTPFAFTFYHPMQIYLGKYDALETLYVFGGGIAWCVVLYFLAKWVFAMGLKRNEAVGL